ncbi:MAG: sugar ABC transporter permease [Spirochaetales bacterium]|nr:sugar ABC transporter permease [Spirochaetales bacterium]
MKKPALGDRFRQVSFAYMFLLPLVALYVMLMFYPLARGTLWSMQDISLARLAGGRPSPFVWLENYSELLRDATFWRKVVPNTIVFVVGSVSLQVLFGTALAILLNQPFIVGRRLMRSLVLLPWVVANVVVAYSWVFIYDSRVGLINRLLLQFGMEPVSLLTSRALVIPAIVVANVWRGTAFSMLVQSSGLQSIPDQLYEAASIDGASIWQKITRITVPMLRRFTLLNILYATMSTLNVFDLIFIMTGGGPLHNSSVVGLYMYEQAFILGRFGYGAAISMVLLAFNLALTFVFLRWFREKN